MAQISLLVLIIGSLIVGCGFDSSVPAGEVEDAALTDIEPGFGDGTIWRVGPERDYKAPSEVARRVGSGDVVLIDAATYECDTGVVWSADRLTLKGVGGRPHIDAEGCGIPGGKGIWNPRGIDLLIDNIEFSGARVSDENGAGIRFEGGGRVIIRNAFFHRNENGILFTPAPTERSTTDLVIEHSEFAFNGTVTGQAHNLYVNNARSLTFRYNYSHDSNVGHLFKSRARNNRILYNRLMTLGGTGSYEIDIPSGGDAWIIGNVIQQGPNSENMGLISFGAEAGRHPERTVPGGHLYVVNNTLINDRVDGANLLTMSDYAFNEIRFANNILAGLSEKDIARLEEIGVEFQNNLITRNPGFKDRSRHNYALAGDAPAIDAGGDPGADHLGQPLAVDEVYAHPKRGQPRRLTGKGLDLGALEYRDDAPGSPRVELVVGETAVDYGADVDLQWTAVDAERCIAGGDWGGELATTGSASIGPLNQTARFVLNCDGPGGTDQALVEVAVADHPLAASYPSYRFIELADTKIQPLCREDFPYRGVGGCKARNLSAAYVPEQNAYYMFGGGHRGYFGNEVIRLDLGQRDLALASDPSDPRETRNFNPSQGGGYWDLIADCRGVWDLRDGSVAPAPANAFTTWIYAPAARKIFKSGGQVACGVSEFDTDSWWFDPFDRNWQLLDREGGIEPGGSHAVYDPDSGQFFLMGRQAFYRFDPASEDLVELAPNRDKPWYTTPVLDPVNDVIIIIGNGPHQENTFVVIDVEGVDGSSRSLPSQQVWTASGDLSLLDQRSPALAYDEDRNVVVGWDGGNKLFFLAVNREKREIEFIARTLDEAPSFDQPKRNTFLYAKEEKAFVVYTGADNNFYLLKPED